MKEFPRLVHYWLEEANLSSVLVIKYEDMLRDFTSELKKMLDFLQVSYSNEDIDCVANGKLEDFHRNRTNSFNHYSPSDRQLVWHSLMSIEGLLNKYNVTYKDGLMYV